MLKAETPPILFVSKGYPPGPGGAERDTQRLAEALWRHGHRTRVLTTVARGVSGDAGPAPVWRLPVPLASPWDDLAFALWVSTQLVMLRPRYPIVHWVMTGLQTYLGMPVAAALGMKNVLKLAGDGEGHRLLQRPRGRRTLDTIRQHADRIIVLNSAMRAELLSLDFRPEQLVTLTCGADEKVFVPADAAQRAALRARWKLAAEGPVLAFTGRFVTEKRLPDLIDAFALLAPRYPHASLVVAGDGPLRTELEAQAAAAGLAGKIRFVGMLPPAQVAEALQLSDVYVLPSSSEGLPCSLVEAIGAGLPSVVTDIPGTEMLGKDGVAGLRVPVQDVASLAGAIERLLRDSDARTRMGRAARALFLERYTIDRIREGYQRVYTELVGD